MAAYIRCFYNHPPVPTVFISYSHQDEDWKDRVVGHLQVLGIHDDLEIWDDRRIERGDDWLPEIQGAMDRAAVAVLLISKGFLTSRFIQGTEVPRLLKRRKEEGLRVIPLFVRPCAWPAVDWLAAIQGTPKDAKPLSGWSDHDADQILADLALEIRSRLKVAGEPPIPEAPNGGAGMKPGVSTPGVQAHPNPPSPEGAQAWAQDGDPARAGGGVPASFPGVETPGYMQSSLRDSPPRLDLGRLPIAGRLLLGRETELTRLDAAWESPETHVLTLVAFGGTGKSALISHWLDRMSAAGWRGARRVLDWSFYSQGTEDRVTSADRFLDHALTWFGDPDPSAGAPRDRGLRLAELVRREKTLLVLDGVEPLQHPPNHPQAGRIKDPGLAALLRNLAGENPGLCVVTTRERIADLESFPMVAPQEDLEALSPQAGAELLKELGVKGSDSEFRAASEEFGNHALALSVLGGYLSRVAKGDVRRRKDVNLAGADQIKGGHALRVIATYATWLGEGPEVVILRMLGLFDRPADPKAIAALRAKPVIPWLTEHLMDLGEEGWQLALSNLREHGLLLPADPHQPDVLDAHPLVRAYFQEYLKSEQPEGWQAGNLRLYEHFQKEAPDLPDTLEEMEPLYIAVVHGCRAGRQQEAFTKVYWRRISQGRKFYSTRKLGAIGAELSALSSFFNHLWDQPSSNLGSQERAHVLNGAGVDLRSLGRLAEAVQPIKAALEIDIQRADWESAAADANNLSELSLALGDIGRAVSFGRQCVNLADQSGEPLWLIGSRTQLADVLHQSGRWEESAKYFRRAEALQEKRKKFVSLTSYRYCSLLISRAEPQGGSALDCIGSDVAAASKVREACRKVREEAERTLKKVTAADFDILSIALNQLILARAHLGLAMTTVAERAEMDFVKATEYLDVSVQGLRRAGIEEFIACGLLTRAALRRLRGDLPAAEADLFEALEIAERGSMRLHECDAHLEWARLCRQRGDRDGMERHVARARKLVEETGYGRRRREVEWLEGQLA